MNQADEGRWDAGLKRRRRIGAAFRYATMASTGLGLLVLAVGFRVAYDLMVTPAELYTLTALGTVMGIGR